MNRKRARLIGTGAVVALAAATISGGLTSASKRTRRIRAGAVLLSLAAIAGLGVSVAQASGPGSGQGLLPVPFTCETLNGSLSYTVTIALPGAALGNGPGALTAPFPGLLIPGQALPAGAYVLVATSFTAFIAPFSLQDFTFIGQKLGLQSDMLACPGDSGAGIPTLLIALANGSKH